MGRETTADKANRLLLERRVVIDSVNRRRVFATVRGTDRYHSVTWTGDHGWRCSCPGLRPTCSHVLSVQAVVVIPPKKDPTP